MKRNRKREPLQFGTVVKTLLICLCVAGIGLAYVKQKNQIYQLGNEIKKREATLASTEKRNVMLAAQLAQYKSPAYLEARCRQYKLDLAPPKEAQMVRLFEPGAEWDARFNQPSSATANATVQPNQSKKSATPGKVRKPATKVVAQR